MPDTNTYQKGLGKNSQAVRSKLIERTAKSERIASKGQEVLAQEIVQTVDLPHQIYIEFLSEHGLFGSVVLLGIFFFTMFQILKEIVRSRNYVQLGAFVFIVINFTPIIPTGSFFSDFNATNFWLNFSIMYACNPNTNIFEKLSKT